ncbi:MAG: hypothetical protein IJH86_04545 [Clostridia bacterium]|nr:hypothetical protein [Clostridia bacterium]MBR0367649.1 hypothetical protein [Clostridia bacterium]
MYLTYDEYQSYGGTLPEADFTLAEFKARKRVDYLTDSRVEAMAEVPEAVKLAMMSIIKADGVVGVDAQAGAPLVASFSTDGYSENYGSAADQTANVERQLNAELRRLLYGVKDDEGVPLLYRGLV